MKTLCRMGAAALLVCAIGLLHAQEKKTVELKVGDKAPVFQATDDTGKVWKSTDLVGKKILVVYFYPADFTGGCTKQACSFRDDKEKLAAKGIEVVGVSGDSAKGHELFKKHHKLNFTLLADEDGAVAKKFGVPTTAGSKTVKGKDSDGKEVDVTRGTTTQRWTFIIDKEGKIAHKDSKVAAAEDSKKVLEAVDKLPK